MAAAQEKKEAIPAIQARLDKIMGMIAEATQKKEQWETNALELAEAAAQARHRCTLFHPICYKYAVAGVGHAGQTSFER